MIQDIYPHKLINHYDPSKTAKPESFVLNFAGARRDAVLLRMLDTTSFTFPTFQEVQAQGNIPVETSHLIYLFTVDEDDYFLLPEVELSLPGYTRATLHDLRESLVGPKWRQFINSTALQLSNWYHQNRFCGSCGSRTKLGKIERAIRCPECGRIIYPRIVPAVIVGITHGDEIILTKYARGFAHYALVAGFTEIGETLEETVQREVMEEVGLKVKNIRYYKSQPWGIVDDILMGFFCDVDGDPTITMDQSELKLASWFKREEIVLQPDDFSLTNEMMCLFKNGKEPRA